MARTKVPCAAREWSVRCEGSQQEDASGSGSGRAQRSAARGRARESVCMCVREGSGREGAEAGRTRTGCAHAARPGRVFCTRQKDDSAGLCRYGSHRVAPWRSLGPDGWLSMCSIQKTRETPGSPGSG